MNKKVMTSVLAVAAAAAGAISTPSLVSAWGDNGGGRASYTKAQVDAGALDGKIVFNSISNSVDGDEKNFVSAQAATDSRQGTWQGNNITVENGKEYVIRLYAHNNNRWGWDAVAENTKVAISVPNTSAKQVQVNGYITSSNATPSKYWDYVNFNASSAFHLEYVYGSAMFYNNNIGKGGIKFSDSVVTNATGGGALIGYDALDGRIPGCYQYDSYVTVKVKAVFDADFTVEKTVRLEGTKDWTNYVNAKVGDRVEFRIEYKNTSENTTHKDVTIKDVLPKNMRYVAGTTKLWDSFNKGSILTPDGAIATTGLKIGDFAAGSNLIIRFTAEVIDADLACGANTLVNWAQATANHVTIQDYASVVLNKTCANTVKPANSTPSQLPSTGPEAVIGGTIAAGSIVTAAGYFIASRRSLR